MSMAAMLLEAEAEISALEARVAAGEQERVATREQLSSITKTMTETQDIVKDIKAKGLPAKTDEAGPPPGAAVQSGPPGGQVEQAINDLSAKVSELRARLEAEPEPEFEVHVHQRDELGRPVTLRVKAQR